MLTRAIADTGGGEIDEDEFMKYITANGDIAQKIKSAGRLNVKIEKLFQFLCDLVVDEDEDDKPKDGEPAVEAITKEDWDAINPQHWASFGIKLSKGDLEKARKECDITKTKSADLERFKTWIFEAKGKVAAKVFAQTLAKITADLEFEVVKENELIERLAAEAGEEADGDPDEMNLAEWRCDVTQFHAWVNSGTEVALLVNEHAAELAWPEPEPDDLNPLLDDSVIKELWAELDWDDDKKISCATLKNLRMLIAMTPTASDMKAFEAEISLDEFGLMTYETFRDWINTETPTAQKTRRYVAAGKRGSDAAERAAKAAAALTAGSFGGVYGGLKVATTGSLAGAKALKQGTTMVSRPVGKVVFNATKITLKTTAKVGGAGGVVMDRLEKSMLDPDLTEDQIQFLLDTFEVEEESTITSQDLVKLRTVLECKLSDKDMKSIRDSLGMTGGQNSCTFDDFSAWIQAPSNAAKKVRHRARGDRNEDPVDIVRIDFEEEMRLRAFHDPDVWIDGRSTKKTKARELPGRRVTVPGYGEGTVVAYKSAKIGKGAHVIEFDVGGTQKMRLDYKQFDFQISSEVFVQEYVDTELASFDEEADVARKKIEEETAKNAMKQSGAWVNPGRMAEEDPEALVGRIIDLGKGKKGPVTDFRKGKHLVSLPNKETGKIKSHAMNLDKLRIKVLSDDYVQTYAGPIIQEVMQKWADAQLDKINFEREEIAAQDELEHEALMQVYLQQQRKQATADAALAADHMFYVHRKAFKKFSKDFKPTASAMDPELIEQAGGIDAVLRQTWITMPRPERAIYEDAAREKILPLQWIPIPPFDQVEPDREWFRVITKTPLRDHYAMDSEKTGNLEAGDEIEVMRTKELRPSKAERKQAQKEGRELLTVLRVKCNGGWCSFNKADGTPLLEKFTRKEPSYVDRNLPLKYIDIVSSVRLTIEEQENMCKELIPGYTCGEENTAKHLYERSNSPECECEVFARWLVGDSEIAEKVRRAAIDMKWSELGALLTYNASSEDEDGFNYERYLFAAKGAYKLVSLPCSYCSLFVRPVCVTNCATVPLCRMCRPSLRLKAVGQLQRW